jgi:hypothetical protein
MHQIKEIGIETLTETMYEDQDASVGFIITRHVNNESANKIWVSCISQIRKSYPTRQIVIIDDNSNYEFVKVPTDNPNILDNCIVINSEYKGAGELLPYYYYSKNKWFDKAIFIHDSVFINGPIPTDDVKNVKFIWEFEPEQVYEERPYIEEFLGYLNYGDELLKLFNDNNRWRGCYGVMSVITHSYAAHLCEKYNLPILTNHVNKRVHRMSMERILAILCFHDGSIHNETSPSIYGHYSNIQGNTSYNYDSYFADLEQNKIGKDPIKLYFGR